MRLIDAGDLRKKIQRWCERGIFSADGILSIVESEIINAPTNNQWIPVTERLPEKDGWYFVTSVSERTYDDGRTVPVSSVGMELFEDGRWSVDDEFTAWMPLPKPYEEGAKNGNG